MGTEQVQAQQTATPELVDDFSDPRSEGGVIGSLSTSGHRRQGVDKEGVLSVDNGALRIAPLIENVFGRAALVYGPFPSRPGLAFGVHMLNGHNTAQAEPLPDTLVQRVDLWLRGSRTEPKWRRLMQWFRSGRVRRGLRQFRRWKRAEKGGREVPLLDENLAVGWFSRADTVDPRTEGNTFIMHALGPENGELWAGHSSCRTRSLRGVQNVPLYLVAVMRGNGVVYYAASLAGVPGLSPYPWLRPLAVDSGAHPVNAYLCIHQSVLGQIGWRIDSRVYGVRVAALTGYDAWWGGAHAADRPSRHARLRGAQAEAGGQWRVWMPANQAVVPKGENCVRAIAVLDPGAPSGLIHAFATRGEGGLEGIGLIWRYKDERNHWRLVINERRCEVILVAEGDSWILSSQAIAESASRKVRLQVLDDGQRLMPYMDGKPAADAWIVDTRLQEATGVGILHEEPGAGTSRVQILEAHPRQIRLPGMLDMGGMWLRKGSRVVVADDFSGERVDLEGRITPVGKVCWRRVIGEGAIEVAAEGVARVRGTPQEPCPGRTAYCVDWPHPGFADLEVTITPPGHKAGQRHRTTAGFILFQDSANYMILNAWRSDSYGGGSISTFFRFRGFEDIYDAVWTNVADRVYYGRPFRLRLCSDGSRYVAFINDEPVLYRSFKDVYADVESLQIRKLGLVANWEFGTDTGSTFEQCVIRY